MPEFEAIVIAVFVVADDFVFAIVVVVVLAAERHLKMLSNFIVLNKLFFLTNFFLIKPIFSL